MTFPSKNYNDRVLNIYNGVIFALVLISVLQRNVLLSNSLVFDRVCQGIEILSYFILIVVIINKKYPTKILVMITIIGAVLFYGYVKSGMAVFFRSLLLIMASRKIDYNKILRTMQHAIICGVAISTVLYVMGLAPDYVSVYHYEGMGFGFGGGNAIGELVSIYIMMECYIRTIKNRKINCLVILIVGVLTLVFSTSKTATIIIIGTPLLLKMSHKIFDKSKRKIRRFLAYMVNPFLFLFAYVTAMLFPVNQFVQKLDLVLTNRFFLNWYALTKYPLTLFGQEVSLHDTGVYNAVRGIGNITVTVDNSYVLSLASLGLIPSIIFSIGYILVVRKAIQNNNTALVGIAILLCAYGFSEVQMIDVYDNFVYLSLMASYGVFAGYVKQTFPMFSRRASQKKKSYITESASSKCAGQLE